MKLLIAGCGFLGTELGRGWARSGRAVCGLKRRPETLAGTGIIPFRADLLDPSTLRKIPPVDLVLLCQAPGRGEGYRATYLEATRNLLEALRGTAVKKILFVSSTGVYGVRDGSVVTELTPSGADFESDEAAANARLLLETENEVLEGTIPGMVLRLGGLYGPKRNRLAAIREGKLIPAASPTFTNRIRVEDAASAAELLLEKGEAGQVYLGVDDEPCTQADFYGWLCPRLGVPPPAPSASLDRGKRVSNAKLKSLGWTPRYPGFREGYADLLGTGAPAR